MWKTRTIHTSDHEHTNENGSIASHSRNNCFFSVAFTFFPSACVTHLDFDTKHNKNRNHFFFHEIHLGNHRDDESGLKNLQRFQYRTSNESLSKWYLAYFWLLSWINIFFFCGGKIMAAVNIERSRNYIHKSTEKLSQTEYIWQKQMEIRSSAIAPTSFSFAFDRPFGADLRRRLPFDLFDKTIFFSANLF